jgi:PAS domain S-box-containing protein
MTDKPTYEELELKIEELQKEAQKLAQTEKELKRKSTELNSFINNLPAMAWLKDTESRFIAVNREFGEAVGMNPESLINQTCEVCFGKEEAKKFREDDQKVMKSTTRVIIEEKITDSQENDIWLETIKSPILDELGKVLGTVGMANDITKNKQAEEGLRESQYRYGLIFNGSRDAIFITGADAKFVDVNDAASVLTGYSKSELKRMSIPDLHEKVDLHAYEFYFESIMAGEPVLSEAKIFKKDRTKVDTEFSNTRITISGIPFMHTVARDITDRKQTEELLRESEERYRTLSENSMVGFWQITLEGYTTYINPAMCSMIEIESPEELSGQTYHPFFTTESLEIIKHERTTRPKGQGSSYEVEIIGKNGGRRNVMICGAPLLSAEDTLQSYIATFTDITDRKRAEEKLRKAHDELEHRVKERTIALEIKTKSLEEINIALEVLLRKREEDKTELEDNVLTNVKELIVPYFEKIKKTKLDNQQETFLSIIESYVNEIISPFTRKMSLKYLNLTPTEIQIANLIRYGSHTKKIAELLNVSPRTVETHRKNIRRKIGLENKRANLRSHLLSLH